MSLIRSLKSSTLSDLATVKTLHMAALEAIMVKAYEVLEFVSVPKVTED